MLNIPEIFGFEFWWIPAKSPLFWENSELFLRIPIPRILTELWSEKFEWFGPSPIEPFNLAGHGRAGGREQEQDREAWRETTQVWNGRGHWLLPRRFEPWSVPSSSFRPLSFTHVHACLVCFEHLTFWNILRAYLQNQVEHFDLKSHRVCYSVDCLTAWDAKQMRWRCTKSRLHEKYLKKKSLQLLI